MQKTALQWIKFKKSFLYFIFLSPISNFLLNKKKEWGRYKKNNIKPLKKERRRRKDKKENEGLDIVCVESNGAQHE